MADLDDTDISAPGKPKIKTWSRQPFPKGSVTRNAGESERDFRRRYDRERYAILKALDPNFLRKCADKAAGFRDRHPDRVAAVKRASVAKNRAHYEAKWKADYAKDAAKYKHVARVWYWANRDRARISGYAWVRNNPEAFRAIQQRRRARERGAEGQFTAAEIRSIFTAQRGRCAMCRDSLRKGKHLDHIMPLALGGSNYARNLQWLCPTCNHRKNAKHPLEFARHVGLLL
jgi:5-methylcytosine-specific restriction endonuclease McrA